MSVIGVAGPARSGKETTADFLKEYLQAECVQSYTYVFAKPLKDFLGRIFDWSDEELYGNRKDRQIDCVLHMDIVECVVADMFSDYLFGKSELRSAVNYLKEVLMEHFFVSGSWLSPIVRFQASPRRCLQIIGTEWAQGFFGKNIWVYFAEETMHDNPDSTMVIPDVRFMAEADFCKTHGILVSVKRDTSKYNVYSEHDSERAFDALMKISDDVVMNYRSLEDLREECKGIAFSYVCNAYANMGCEK